jgi:hypothetical protein
MAISSLFLDPEWGTLRASEEEKGQKPTAFPANARSNKPSRTRGMPTSVSSSQKRSNSIRDPQVIRVKAAKIRRTPFHGCVVACTARNPHRSLSTRYRLPGLTQTRPGLVIRARAHHSDFEYRIKAGKAALTSVLCSIIWNCGRRPPALSWALHLLFRVTTSAGILLFLAWVFDPLRRDRCILNSTETSASGAGLS